MASLPATRPGGRGSGNRGGAPCRSCPRRATHGVAPFASAARAGAPGAALAAHRWEHRIAAAPVAARGGAPSARIGRASRSTRGLPGRASMASRRRGCPRHLVRGRRLASVVRTRAPGGRSGCEWWGRGLRAPSVARIVEGSRRLWRTSSGGGSRSSFRAAASHPILCRQVADRPEPHRGDAPLTRTATTPARGVSPSTVSRCWEESRWRCCSWGEQRPAPHEFVLPFCRPTLAFLEVFALGGIPGRT